MLSLLHYSLIFCIFVPENNKSIPIPNEKRVLLAVVALWIAAAVMAQVVDAFQGILPVTDPAEP